MHLHAAPAHPCVRCVRPHSLALVYAAMAVFIFLAPPIIEKLTARVAIVCGACCYWCVCGGWGGEPQAVCSCAVLHVAVSQAADNHGDNDL